MKKELKAELIGEISEKISNHGTFYVSDASGLSVAEVNRFRKMCFEAGLEYVVYKNTLIQKALEQLEGDYSGIYPALKGFSGVIFSKESASAPAKVLKKYRAGVGSKPLLKGAAVETDVFLGDENLDVLAKLKSKNDLIGEVIGLLQSPAKNVISALSSGGHTLSGILKTLSAKSE